MLNLAAIDDNKDLVTKEYVDGKDTPFPLDITDPDIDLSTTPSTARYDQTLRGLDANGDIIWAVDSVHDTSGAHGFQFNSFGGNNQNSLQMLMKPDGTAAMWISQPAVWRNALGAAASSHNHAASNITSGVLATARGGVPTGGTTGQVLAKTSDSNNAVGWVTPSGGGGGGSQIDLLWTNPNPTGNFAAQTLSNIPWQNYKFLLIDHYTAGNGNVAEHYETSVISTANPSVWSWITCIREVPFGRGVKFPASNQVQFGSQTYYSTYNGADATIFDDWPFIVPTKIWGLKDSGGTNPDTDWTQSTYAGGYYMRRGKMVTVKCESYGSITAPNNSYATVFTLPQGFRLSAPGGELFGACSTLGGSYPVSYRIKDDGTVSVGGCGTSPNNWAFSTTFPCE